MCKCVVNVQMRGQCANVRMCKCANGRFKLQRFIACKCVVNVQMCECANCRFKLLRFIACKCFLLQMRGQCANVRMCKCANCRFKLLRFIACKCFLLQMLSYAKATICTFAHSHICTLIYCPLVFFSASIMRP